MTPTRRVRDAVRLQRRSARDDVRRFLVEGAQGVGEALAHEPPLLDRLFTTDPLDADAVRAADAGVTVEVVDPAAIAAIASTVTPQPVVGIAPYLDVDLDAVGVDGCIAILHEVRDPGNAGTVLRSADAAGASGVVFTTESVDVYNPKTVRSSAGSIFHLPVVRGAAIVPAVGSMRARGVRVLAMAGDGARSLYATDLTGPIAFLFGNEAHGLDGAARALADEVVHVPQPGRAESLNLAAAATVCLFEWARRRRDTPTPLETVIAAAAHDIRSPLTALKGFGYALERRWRELGDEERELMLTGMLHDADRMEQVLRLLVDAARVADGAVDLFPELVDLEALVGEIAGQQARDPDHPALAWSGDPGPYLVDPARLRTALLAACEALVWWAGPGPIEISGVARDGSLEVTVDRPAPEGLDAGGLDALFEARAPGSGGGSKIGLFVTRGVARAQGGDAWASIEDGRLRIHLRLPLPG
jgi:TrmH family RNA methyltransferase